MTSTTYKAGDLGGLAGADAKCQARAMAAGLTGTFRAWLSDATNSPSSRFPQDAGPYLLVNGGLVANNWIGPHLRDAPPRHQHHRARHGGAHGDPPRLHDPDRLDRHGDRRHARAICSSTCGDWTDSSVFSVWLGTTSSQADWTASACGGVSGTSAATGCGALAPIYCFEQ